MLSLKTENAILLKIEEQGTDYKVISEQSIDSNLIQKGDYLKVSRFSNDFSLIIKVVPGERIPIDGVVVSGETSIDESMITGESLPVPKKRGDSVIGGTINQLGSIMQMSLF